jgi:hypothetical protein
MGASVFSPPRVSFLVQVKGLVGEQNFSLRSDWDQTENPLNESIEFA